AKMLVGGRLVAGEVVEAEHHVRQLALLVRRLKFHERGAARDKLGHDAVLVGERVCFHLLSSRCLTKTGRPLRFASGACLGASKGSKSDHSQGSEYVHEGARLVVGLIGYIMARNHSKKNRI